MGRLGKSLMWSAVLVAGAWLVGCASDTPEKPNAETKQQTSIPSLEEFTTVGKPTKTIQTPWGNQEIYDPTQDAVIKQQFKKWYEEDSYSIIDYTQYLGQSNEWEVFLKAEAVQALDLKRAGCEAVIQGNGRLESYNKVEKGGLEPRTKLLYFTKDCGNQHNFGAYKLTTCESSNKSTIPKSKTRRTAFKRRVTGEQTLEAPMVFKANEVGIKISDMQIERSDFNIFDNGVKHEVIGASSGKSSSSQLSNIFSQTCEKWRGIKPHEQISFTTKEGFTVFLLDLYPEEPLAPPEFQTPDYRKLVTENRKELP